MSDEGFHEIQLNGKQLVFLFMAATVVSVVIFLCGVMVGRGVRARRGDDDAERRARAAPAQAAAGACRPRAPRQHRARRRRRSASLPTPPKPDEDDVGLQGPDGRQAEDIALATPAKVRPSPPRLRRAPRRRSAAATEKAAVAEKAAPKPEPPAPWTRTACGRDVAAATPCRSPRCAIAPKPTPSSSAWRGRAIRRTSSTRVPGKPPVYKVQVGRFAERGDAEKIASKLQKEEQFSPWVTR